MIPVYLPPLPDPPPQAVGHVAYIHWTDFYRAPMRLHVWHTKYRSVYR